MAIKKKKEITLEDLALEMRKYFKLADEKMETGFKLADEKMETGFKLADDATEALARMVAGSFKLADEKMETGFKQSEDSIEDLARIVAGSFDKTNARIASHEETNAMEHQEMKSHLNNMAYRFELNDLGRRVSILEKKVK